MAQPHFESDALKTAILATALLSAIPCFAADAEPTIGADDCKIINPAPTSRERVTWSGACKDGYADGVGILEWFAQGKLTLHFKGTLRRGLQHGEGYTEKPNGIQYEGGFADGERSGKGVELLVDGTEYDGEWKNGKRDGTGAMTYATGGSYVGQWKGGRYHGSGKLTYTSGKVFEGEFNQGLPAGHAPVDRLRELKKYDLRGETPPTGSAINAVIASGPVPFRKSWDAMTRDEQRAVRILYGALAETDEPPFPADGSSSIMRAISSAQNSLLVRGQLRMNVQVDALGNATSVTVFASPDPVMTKVASFAAVNQKYKPALCNGVPCAMIYPVHIQFTVGL